MKIHNFLPGLLECLERWETPPAYRDFAERYYSPMQSLCELAFGDAHGLFSEIPDLNWPLYREETRRLDPAAEEKRLRRAIAAVEGLFGITLEGDAILFGAFTGMDGYARFHEGRHQVFLGVDESHGRGAYLDILMVHELTHVVRESRPEVWRGFGLSPTMTHDEFVENQPVIEHLMGEGLSCAISRRLVASDEPWHYAYQTQDSFAQVFERAPAVDREIRAELALGRDGDYGRLYNPGRYGRGMPQFTHYVWAWKWAEAVIRDFGGGDPRAVVDRCSAEFLEHAMSFELGAALTDT